MQLEKQEYILGPKLVAKGPRKRPVIYLPNEFEFLRGKKVYVILKVFEPPKKNPEYVSEGVG